MRGRPKKNIDMNANQEAIIECPNCGMSSKLTYTEATYQPPYYNQCTFCNTKFKWTKTTCQIIVPADKKQYIIIKRE